MGIDWVDPDRFRQATTEELNFIWVVRDPEVLDSGKFGSILSPAACNGHNARRARPIRPARFLEIARNNRLRLVYIDDENVFRHVQVGEHGRVWVEIQPSDNSESALERMNQEIAKLGRIGAAHFWSEWADELDPGWEGTWLGGHGRVNVYFRDHLAKTNDWMTEFAEVAMERLRR